MDQNTNVGQGQHLASARRTFTIEIQALEALRDRLDTHFEQAVDMLLSCAGRVVVTGIGKSGHIARKVAATLASTGTPSFFMHGAEAVHGDLGMITGHDIVIAISYSGAASELMTVLTTAKRMGARIITITGNPQSELARNADIHLHAGVEQEACPLNLAPTASTTAALVLGDALAVACLQARHFSAEDFARSHPGGALGRRLLTYVRVVMRHGDALPLVREDTPMQEALKEMSAKRMGMTIVVDDANHPIGIFTDGDLRRLIERCGDVRGLKVGDGMTRNPRSVPANTLAVQAAARMDEGRLNQILVVDEAGLLLEGLHRHDLTGVKGI